MKKKVSALLKLNLTLLTRIEVSHEDSSHGEVDESIDEETVVQKTENDSTCPDLCKVEQILENL